MTTRREIEAKVAARLAASAPAAEPVLTPRQKIEASVAARVAQGMPPKKITVDEYIASPQGQAERRRMEEADSEYRSFGDNMAIKSADVIGGIGSGISQLYSRATGDEAGLAAKQSAEAEHRAIMDPVEHTAGGVTGNVLTNAALFALPAAKVAQGAKWAGQAATLAPKTAALITALAGEGLIGGASGAMTPTVEGESLGKNIGTSAAINAAFPLAGSFLRTPIVQKAADTILDYTPFLSGARRKARNVALKTAYEAEKEATSAANTAAKDQFKAAVTSDEIAQKAANQSVKEARAAAVDEAKKRTQYVKALAEGTAENETRALHEAGRKHLAESAGWSKFPKNKVEAEQELQAVGKQYGAMIEPVRMPVPKMDDFTPVKGSDLAAHIKTISDSADITGNIKGETYRDVRAEAVEALFGAKGEERKQLKTLISRLDENFESSLPKDVYDDVVKKRAQYSLGATMKNADWVPGEGATVESLRKRIDNGHIADDVRLALYPTIEKLKNLKTAERIDDTVPRDIPDAAIIPARDAPDLLPTPNTPSYEQQDLIRLGAVNTGAAATLGPSAVTLPIAALAIKGANNDKIAKMVAALNRGAATGYGTVLAPKED